VFVTADEASSNLWYLLSLLALVPIGVLAVLCYKRLGTETKPKVESTSSDCPRDETDNYVDEREDEVPSPAAPVPALARITDVSQQQSDPLAPPPLVAAMARLITDNVPDYKDQCRLEPAGERLNPPAPLANALWVHSEDADNAKV
jgi:hypothetical protein